MYRLDWIEQLKLKTTGLPSMPQASAISPVVWYLGFTSLLTDISAEMVNSMLPVYLVLHLRVSPLAFGAIDGIYNGMAVALLGLAGGYLADRWRRHRDVAAFGYGISAVCKLGLLAAGSTIGWIGAVTTVDRIGKGMRTAPRDALLSLNSSPLLLATSFAVHRAMDAGGSLLGPIVAFVLAACLPGAYDAMWITSFVFALLGVAALWLFVGNPSRSTPEQKPAFQSGLRALSSSRDFRMIVVVGSVLGAATVSDAFIYLALQRQNNIGVQFFPLYYVITASVYMVLSIPVGWIADRMGRKQVLLAGYCVLAVIYALVGSEVTTNTLTILVLLLFGVYYAATEGILMALAASLIPSDLRTTGLAILTTGIGAGKMVSSVAFGWLWQTQNLSTAMFGFLGILTAALVLSWRTLQKEHHEQFSQP